MTWATTLLLVPFTAAAQNPPPSSAVPAVVSRSAAEGVEKSHTDSGQAPPTAQPAEAEKSVKPKSLRERAEALLVDGLNSSSADRRAQAVAALGLLRGNRRACHQALAALKDEKSVVRSAAAASLGSMHALEARHDLEAALQDSEPNVVLAAANSLLELKDRAGYEVYYGVLTGERKASKGFVGQQLAILHDKKKMAELGLNEGIGFVPFAGIPYSVLRMTLKDDSSGPRAAAARKLASDPDPASRDALIEALGDRSWLVRVAALQALSERGDSPVLDKIAPLLDDDKEEVRFFAAACILQLSRNDSSRGHRQGHTVEQARATNGGKD